jgi:hypothetical protein
MLANSAKSAEVISLLAPVNAGNTTAATSLGVDIRKYEGDILIIENVGVVTAGTITGKLQACSAADGTGAEDITGATFVQAGTSTDDRLATYVLSSEALPKAKPFLRYIGTIATGPAQVAVTFVSRPKYID